MLSKRAQKVELFHSISPNENKYDDFPLAKAHSLPFVAHTHKSMNRFNLIFVDL